MQDKTKFKKIAIISGFCVSVLAVLLIIILNIFNITPSASEQADHGAGDEANEPTIIFENRYQLNYSIGNSNAAVALTQIETALLNEKELSSSPSVNQPEDGLGANFYTATIVEGSFGRLSESPEVYQFDLDLTDGRKYKVYVFFELDQTEDDAYIATALTRIDDKKTPGYFTYISTKNEAFGSSFRNWLRDALGLEQADVVYIERLSEEEPTVEDSTVENSDDQSPDLDFEE